jgi:carboxynorspermidine decarboxylase
VFEDALRSNARLLSAVRERTGCKVLLALKAFAMPAAFPLIREFLDGTCASSPDEARLGREAFGGEVHAFAAAYSRRDVDALLGICDHLVFNSFGQWERFGDHARRTAPSVSFGIRVNPCRSEAPAAVYDPCAPGSRLGVHPSRFDRRALEGISGLHFHTLCEQNADALERTLAAFERHFGDVLPDMRWINVGGGHHVTRPDYDVDLLCRLLTGLRERYGVDVYVEPGEAVALNSGVLVATVLDLTWNELDIAVLDVAVPCHMPDVMEMPYRPGIVGAGLPGEKAHTYRLAGLSCLAGDVAGDYSFDQPLRVGDRVVFTDMAHYTMVKTNTFNGVRLPSLALYNETEDAIRVVREFGYRDFLERLS